MKYPTLYAKENSRQMVDTFKGYNHNLRIGDGEFFDMKNMTSDYYPVLSPRGKRGLYASPNKPTGLIAKDSLCYVDGSKFFINEYKVDMGLGTECDTCSRKSNCSEYIAGKTVCQKQLISMGAYVIIMPDKKWVNTEDHSFGDIEAFYSLPEGVRATYSMCNLVGTEYDLTAENKSPTAPDNPENMQLWIDESSTPHVLKQYSGTSATWTQIATTYVKISAPGIAHNFSQYDAVKISGFPQESAQLSEMNDITYPLWEVYHDPGDDERAEGTNDYVVIVGILDEADTYESDLKLERTIPIMDFIIESGNRLYGCRYGLAANGEMVNEIYASKLGDFKNWNCFMQISTDSWVGGVGTDGQFTGAITHGGYPLFFKENFVHKVYGNYPANFQIQTTACRGVQMDCHRSLAIVNETLFYKSRSGVCAYDGSLPTEVSYALGNEAYSNAVGGSHGNKYYISMKDVRGNYNLFVYDMAKGMWHKEDDLKVDSFCSCRGEMYAISNGEIIAMLGSGTPGDPVEWMAQTGEIGISSPDMKYISRLAVRMAMEIGAEVRIYGQYDFNDEWESLCYLRNTDSLRSFSIPIRPKRCDYMKLRIEGEGMAKIYSITKTIEQGSDRS